MICPYCLNKSTYCVNTQHEFIYGSKDYWCLTVFKYKLSMIGFHTGTPYISSIEGEEIEINILEFDFAEAYNILIKINTKVNNLIAFT